MSNDSVNSKPESTTGSWNRPNPLPTKRCRACGETLVWKANADAERSYILQTSVEIARFRQDCAEAYQAVGFLADCLGIAADDPRHAQLTKLLDNLSAASDGRPRPHADLLPFGWQA